MTKKKPNRKNLLNIDTKHKNDQTLQRQQFPNKVSSLLPTMAILSHSLAHKITRLLLVGFCHTVPYSRVAQMTRDTILYEESSEDVLVSTITNYYYGR